MAKISGVIRGDSHTINLTITDGGSPVNLTGYTVFFTVNADKDPVSDSAAAIEKDVTSFISPTSGEATIELDPADTNSLEPGGYWYDIQLKDGSGNITSFPKDRFTIVSDITRRTT